MTENSLKVPSAKNSRSPSREKSPLHDRIALFTQSANSNDPHKLGEQEYGRPTVGSKTEARGLKAHAHVFKEILELCELINSEGRLKFTDDEGTLHVGILFGDLFRMYTIISDKCVGLLLRARKYKLLAFEGETLFQRRDDDKPIFLMKTIKDIRQELRPTTQGADTTVPWHTGVTETNAAT